MSHYTQSSGGVWSPVHTVTSGAGRRRAVAFRPEEHFRNLKGQHYLEVKWRLVWFREEHPEGFVESFLVEHDPVEGRAVFRARVGYWQDGREVFATGWGTETRKDFGEYAEKAETKAVGRALAMLGYGTAQALELEEPEGEVVDAPANRRARTTTPRNEGRGLAVVREPATKDALHKQVTEALEADAEAAAKLPKAPGEMTEAELTKTLAWLARRARALSS